MVGDDHTGQSTAAVDNVQDRSIDGPKVPITELFSLVRHSKFNILKDSIDYLPSKPFDKSLVQVPIFNIVKLQHSCDYCYVC